MKSSVFLRYLLCLSALLAGPAVGQEAKQAYAEPTVSPDEQLIAFVSNSQIWESAVQGGAAHVLVGDADAGNEHPAYSPDRSSLAFQKTRGAARGIYVLNLSSGQLRRVTWEDGSDVLDGWSADGKWIYFSSGRENVDDAFRGIYRVSAEGGTPMPVLNGVYQDQEMSAPSRDGHSLAFSFGGLPGWQWWRSGRSHIDTAAIWRADMDGSALGFTRLTPDDARAQWPMWGNGGTLYYVSDRSGVENIWRSDAGGVQTQVTRFTDGRVLWPHISAAGNLIVFERGLRIWSLDLRGLQAAPIGVSARAASVPMADAWLPVNGNLTDLALSPDGRQVAVLAKGHLLVGATQAPFATIDLKVPESELYQPSWAPDGKGLVYVSRRSGRLGLYYYDFSRRAERALASGSQSYGHPVFSPDGKFVAFLQGQDVLGIVDMAGGKLRVLARDHFKLPEPLAEPQSLSWSPDGRWIAYLCFGVRQFATVKVVSAQGDEPLTVAALGNTAAGELRWSPHGDSIFYVTGQRTEHARIARIRLVDPPPTFASDALEERLRGGKPGDAALSFHGTLPAGDRVSYLPIDADVTGLAFDARGKWLLYSANSADHDYIYVMPIDSVRDDVVPVQLTSFEPHAKASVWLDPEVAQLQVASDGKSVYFNRHGEIKRMTLDLGGDHLDSSDIKHEDIALSGQIHVQFGVQKLLEFEQLWATLRDTFYDAPRVGAQWDRLKEQYAAYIVGAADRHTLYRLFDLMIGELNSSHSGVYEPDDSGQVGLARLGMVFDRGAYERDGMLKVSAVLPDGPAVAGDRIHAGDTIVAINDVPVDPVHDINAALENMVGQRCRVELRSGTTGRVVTVDLKPVDAKAGHDLVYDDWVAHNRKWVRQQSGGRIGYLHLRDMTEPSLNQFYKDLNAENASAQAVIVDVRNNFGGFVNSYVLDALSRRGYIYMQPRGLDTRESARAMLGQHSLERPTVLLVNRVTLSDGEDFTEGYRDLGLGKVVGEDTAGWIIYTSGTKLLDGGSLRLPFIRITGKTGDDLENNPRKVDFPVPARPVFGYGQDDGYLARALEAVR